VRLNAIIAFLVACFSVVAVLPAGSQQSGPAQSQNARHFTDEDRESMRAWYALHRSEPPLGVRGKDRLPGELQKQLVAHEVLPEELRARMHPVSADFLGRVPPVAEGCKYVFIGGSAVLLDAKSYYVYDVYRFGTK
jgi:hypothetical protein